MTPLSNCLPRQYRLVKPMDLMYDQIPEGQALFHQGYFKPQKANLYPTDIAPHRLGKKNIAKSPLLAYEFKLQRSSCICGNQLRSNFNVDAWAKLYNYGSPSREPGKPIQAIKGQVEVSTLPIKKSRHHLWLLGIQVVLGRIDKPTVAHEVWPYLGQPPRWHY